MCYCVLTSVVTSPYFLLHLHFTPFETLERTEQFSGNFSFVAPRKKKLWAHWYQL